MVRNIPTRFIFSWFSFDQDFLYRSNLRLVIFLLDFLGIMILPQIYIRGSRIKIMEEYAKWL